jgi:hypothetical protein
MKTKKSSSNRKKFQNHSLLRKKKDRGSLWQHSWPQYSLDYVFFFFLNFRNKIDCNTSFRLFISSLISFCN